MHPSVDAASPVPEVSEKSGLPPIAPDTVEQDEPEEMDEVVPTRGFGMLPIVALGGSAGSIPALQAFFQAMPRDSGLTFVVILHLASDHISILDEVLARSTEMPVTQAQDGQKVEANFVYVIPPGQILTLTDDHLRLTEMKAGWGKRVAVDLFFRALADTHGPHAMAIVLSGGDGDGALGIKRIKERGGLTIAQDPDEAEHPSMPRTAIDTGMVDWILPVQDMPARLLQYRSNETLLRLPAESGPQPAASAAVETEEAEKALREVLAYLRSRTGGDFSYYKRATIVRRVSRRMQVNGVATLPEYLLFLRMHPGETAALQQDLLISVTNFFRDRECFDALEARIPMLFAGKGAGDSVRVWVAACASGEEAFSIAMLLMEHASLLESPPTIQVFATDLDEEVIRLAREGQYPLSIAADVSEERLRRFFVKDHLGYRVRRDLRECVLFAVHDLLKDAPFSRVDLISCRNLLIYLTPDAQTRAIEIFHFALRPGGQLFLGTSESIDEENTLFGLVDKKHRLYEQRPSSRGHVPLPIGHTTIARALAIQERAKNGPLLHGKEFGGNATAAVMEEAELADLRRVSWEELHFKLLERIAPPSLIVTRDYNIVHVSQNAGRYLHFSGGEPSVNLLRVVHPMLRVELRAALFRAAQSNRPVEVFRIPVEVEGKTTSVDIRVTPAQDIAPEYLLVAFAEREETESLAAQAAVQAESEPAMRYMERELEQMKLRLRETVEQYEASTEELKASNEELQAMNEELRSATEELETSREELQSINEELTTVNQELKSKVEELGLANNDLTNFMSATNIATIFVDRRLRITRYTPTAVSLFHLIASDVGRPLTDLTHRLKYPEMREDAERVLATLIPVKRAVPDSEGRWFLAQLLPYRTAEDHIAGAVLSFVDVTESRQAEQALREAEERMRFATEAANIYAWETDPETLRTRYASNTERVLGFQLPEDAKDLAALIHPDDRAEVAEKFTQARTNKARFDIEYRLVNPKTGAPVWLSSHGLFVAELHGAERFIGITQDITGRRQAEEALRESQERLRLIVENARDYAIFSMDLQRRVTSWNSGAQAILGYEPEEMLGHTADVIFTPEDRAAGAAEQEALKALAEGRATDERWHVCKDGVRFWGSGVMMPMHDARGESVGLVKIFRDETNELRAKEALERSREDLLAALKETEAARAEAEAATQAKDHLLAVLSHELRTPLTPILMSVEIMKRRSDIPAPVADALEMIRRNALIEARFVDDLLDITRIARGKLEILREPLDVHEAISDAIKISTPDLEAKEQVLRLALDAEEHRMTGDFTRLQQVFWNLLKNASKFSAVKSEIWLRSRNEPGRMIIELADQGIGIEEEALPRIFHAFEQADRKVTREFGGLGLGLAIAKATVEAHDGAIRVASPGVGQGATFTVELPL